MTEQEPNKTEFINIYRISKTRYGTEIGEQVASLAYDPSKMPYQVVEEIVDALTLRYNTPAVALTSSLYPDETYPPRTLDYWVLIEGHDGQGEFVPDYSD